MTIVMRTLAACLYLLGVTAAAAGASDWRSWVEEAQNQHALAGRVYDVALAKLLDRAEGSIPVLPEGLVLLGEVHDNPAHHEVRALLLAEALAARPGWRPAVVFEQIDAGQQPALEQFKRRAEAPGGSAIADDLFRLLDWGKSGWPREEIYRPLFDAVLVAKLPIFAGNPLPKQVRAVARGGLMPIAPDERARLRLDDPMPAILTEALHQELAASHCGALPAQAIGGMAAAQRYRDAHLADALLNAARRHGSAILIAGNGHVRSDRGVPWHIRERAPETRVVSVLFLEAENGKMEPADYVPRDPQGRPAADWIVFTPRAERGDPCQSLRRKGSDPSPPR